MPPTNASGGSLGDEHADASQPETAPAGSTRAPANPQAGTQPQPQISLRQSSPHTAARLQRTHSTAASRIANAAPAQHAPAYTFATSAAAAATSAKNRPKLNVSTTYPNNAVQGSLPSPPSGTAPQQAVPTQHHGRRRLWFRRKSGGPATSLLVDSSELVDDVKSRILLKYPTSLLQNCDPADLVLAVPSPGPHPWVELQPDENVWAVLDQYYASGMTINDALELSLPDHPPPQQQQQPQPSSSIASARSALQRARSYSNSHYQAYSTLSPPTANGAPSMPPPHPGSSEPNTPLSISPHGPSPSAPLSSHSSTGPQSPTTEAPHDSRHNTSVLLMPRQLGVPSGPLSVSAERELDGHATTLVPLTGEPSSSSAPNWTDTASGSANLDGNNINSGSSYTNGNSNSSVANQLHSISASWMPSSGQSSLQPGKSSVVPKINVLIVEDNKINQLILERFLQRKSVRCAVATNGREALEKWRTGGFHLILMDIQLPEMSGLEVTKEIRRLEIVNGIGAFPQAFRNQELPSAPASKDVLPKSEGGFRSPVIIVALTASSEMLDKSEALAAGCNDFLTKPVNLTWLEQKITEWGCMQALIDYAGWKQWSAETPTPTISRFHGQLEQPQVQKDHSQNPMATST